MMTKEQTLKFVIDRLIKFTKLRFETTKQQAQELEKILKEAALNIQYRGLDSVSSPLSGVLEEFAQEYKNRQFLSEVTWQDLVTPHTNDLRHFLEAFQNTGFDIKKTREQLEKAQGGE